MTGSGIRYSTAVHSPGGGTALVTGFSGSPGKLRIGFHLIVVDRPIRVRGYHFQGTNIAGSWRFWLNRANSQTGLPYGPAIELSDTFERIAGDTNSDRTRDKVGVTSIWGPTAASTTQYIDFVLPNVVEIIEPGVYWIGIARNSPVNVGEAYYGSWLAGYIRGLRDLKSTEVINDTSIGSFDPASLTAINLANPLRQQKFVFPDEDPDSLDICNVAVGLITERWFNG